MSELAVALAEDGDVGVEGDVRETVGEERGEIGSVAHEDAGVFAGTAGGGDDAGEAVRERRSVAVAVDGEVVGEIGGSDEQHIDAVDGGDGIGVFDAAQGFDLGEEERGRNRIGRAQAVVVGAGRARQSAATARRIVHRLQAGARLIGRLDVGHHDAGGTPIEGMQDEVGVRCADAHDRQGGRAADGLEIGEECGFGAGAVFEIEEEPVEAGERGEFSDDG